VNLTAHEPVNRLRRLQVTHKPMTVSAFRFLAFLLFLHAPGAAATTDLKVMSFNIRYGTANDGENSWENRKDFLVDVIEEEDADIIGTQEALRFQLDYIKESLSDYGVFGVGRDDGQEAGEYSAILYRLERFDSVESGTFCLSDTPGVPSSWPEGSAIAGTPIRSL